MAKHPQIPEPRGVSQGVWLATCIAILILAAVMATFVPSFTTKIKQAITTYPSPNAQRVPDIKRVRLEPAEVFVDKTYHFGRDAIGNVAEIAIPEPEKRRFLCLAVMPPGGSVWQPFPGKYAAFANYDGTPAVPTTRNVEYLLIKDAPFTLGYVAAPTARECP